MEFEFATGGSMSFSFAVCHSGSTNAKESSVMNYSVAATPLTTSTLVSNDVLSGMGTETEE